LFWLWHITWWWQIQSSKGTNVLLRWIMPAIAGAK
jgi:hypothetical protein